MQKILSQLEVVTLAVIVFLAPLVVLSIFPNPFIVPKILVLVLGLCIALFLKALQILTNKHIKITFGFFDLSVLVLALAYALSTIYRTPNKMEAVLQPGNATAIVGSAILYFLINQLDERGKKVIRVSLISAGVFTAIASLLAAAGILGTLKILPEAGPSTAFSLLGGSIAGLLFTVGVLPLTIGTSIKSRDILTKAFFGVCAFIILFGAIISGIDALGSDPSQALPSFRTSWYVSVDSLKEKPLFGVGPGNYLSAYSRFRPITDNLTASWATRFTTARSFYLSVLTETGLLGATGIIFLFLSIFRLFRKTSADEDNLTETLIANESFASLLLLLVFLLAFPLFAGTAILLFTLLSLASGGKSRSVNITGQFSLFFAIPFAIVSLIVLYFAGRMTLAEARFQTALNAIRANNGKDAYDRTQETISLNPYVDRYRTTYAQLNLILANSIAAKEKETVTDQDRQTISQLVQQAIREGKNAVALNRERAGNWENLGNIYRSIIPLAKGADSFALQTYSQAIALDPGNVTSRLAVGGIFYSLKNYDAAIETFKLAVSAKPNYANAFYNLGIAYRESGDIERSIQSLEKVLSLLDPKSKDYEATQKQLEDLKAKRPAKPAETGNELTPPATPAPTLDPQLDLGQEATPPDAPEVPQATPAPSEEPQP